MRTISRSIGAIVVLTACLALQACGGAGTRGPTPLMDSRGKLKGEIYTFKGLPPYWFKVPASATPIERVNPDAQVVQLRVAETGVLASAVAYVGDGFKLKMAGQLYLNVMEQTRGKDHDLISNVPIKLGDGTKAYETKIRWFLIKDNTEVATTVVSAWKLDQVVMVMSHCPKNKGGDLSWVPRSLRFTKPPTR